MQQEKNLIYLQPLKNVTEYNTKNLYARFKELPAQVKEDPKLIEAMRHYDHTVNITWVMAHYNAAKYYIEGAKTQSGEEIEATGGSDWTKYMHPKYQRRIFFPEVWTKDEIKNWGTNL
jgi:tryptophan 2,3-dioxygenase